MSILGFDAMNSAPAAKHYPETAYPKDVQKKIFNEALRKLLGSIDSPERDAIKEAAWREAFKDGDRIYVDRSKLVNALIKAKEIFDKPDVQGVEFAEVDSQPRKLTIARVKGSGRWVVLTNEAAEVVDNR